MSKPIEEGCRAVVVNSIAGNDGTEVTVLEYLGDVKVVKGNKVWRIDKKLKIVGSKSGDDRGISGLIDERQLRRIDDNDEQLSTWEAVESVCGFNPAKDVCKED